MSFAKQFRAVFPKVIRQQVVIPDPASIAAGASSTFVVSVPGARLGDIVLGGFNVDMQDVVVYWYVQASDVVELKIFNATGGARDFPALTVNLVVLGTGL